MDRTDPDSWNNSLAQLCDETVTLKLAIGFEFEEALVLGRGIEIDPVGDELVAQALAYRE